MVNFNKVADSDINHIDKLVDIKIPRVPRLFVICNQKHVALTHRFEKKFPFPATGGNVYLVIAGSASGRSVGSVHGTVKVTVMMDSVNVGEMEIYVNDSLQTHMALVPAFFLLKNFSRASNHTLEIVPNNLNSSRSDENDLFSAMVMEF